MAIEKVRAYFERYGMAERIMEFEQSSATVELAARAVGCEPARIGKTMSFRLGERVLLIMTAGDAKIDNGKYKTEFGGKAVMLKLDEVEPLIGHDVGGVCPFGINSGVEVYLDESLRRFEMVYPAAGSDNSAIGLNMQELEEYSGSLGWIDVCKY